MNMRRIALLVFIIITAATSNPRVEAQSAKESVTLPVLSFVTDSTHGLRPVIGIAGSASIGAVVDLGFEITRAEVPPSHDYILAMTKESNWPLLIQLRGGAATVRSMTLDEAIKIDRIALSPAGSSAAFFSESQHRIYVVANLPKEPAPLGAFDMSQVGKVVAFALGDDGRTAAAGVSDGETGAVFLLTLNQAPRLIASMRHPSVIAFLHKSDSAVVADDVENNVYALRDGQLFRIATAEQGISGPIGIAVSNDNQRIFIGNSVSGSVTAIGPYGDVAEPKSCNCALTGLHATNADSVFRLTDFSGGPVLLFDGNAEAPRIIFVPAGSQF